jgi:hypothetical protein
MEVTQNSLGSRSSFKLDFIVIGNQNAGKTSLIKSFSVGEGTNSCFKVRGLQSCIHTHNWNEPGQESCLREWAANQSVHLGYRRPVEVLCPDESVLQEGRRCIGGVRCQ